MSDLPSRKYVRTGDVIPFEKLVETLYDQNVPPGDAEYFTQRASEGAQVGSVNKLYNRFQRENRMRTTDVRTELKTTIPLSMLSAIIESGFSEAIMSMKARAANVPLRETIEYCKNNRASIEAVVDKVYSSINMSRVHTIPPRQTAIRATEPAKPKRPGNDKWLTP